MNPKNTRKYIVNFSKTYCKNFQGIEMGLSGGIDSAVSLSLAYEALGKDRVHCQMMPFKENDNLKDAIELASNFKVDWVVRNINPVYDMFCISGDSWSDKAKQNLMARIRMCFLYSEASSNNRIVLGTCNKSEIALGYFTKFGDGGSDIEPIGDLVKRHVCELAIDWNENENNPQIPINILTKKPSADLFEGQTDEGELGITYKEIDNYLLFLDFGNKNKKCDLSKESLDKILDIVHQTEHKRNPPLILTIPSRFINEDESSVGSMSDSDIIKILRNYVNTSTSVNFQNIARSVLID